MDHILFNCLFIAFKSKYILNSYTVQEEAEIYVKKYTKYIYMTK